jgi:hypothetical protein
MIRSGWRSLLLLAMLLMPFGMVPAAAAAGHQYGASMPMQHCPEQGPNDAPNGASPECTMACSAALPAAEFDRGMPLLIGSLPNGPAVAVALVGLRPDTATPPPRTS